MELAKLPVVDNQARLRCIGRVDPGRPPRRQGEGQSGRHENGHRHQFDLDHVLFSLYDR